MSFNNFDTNNDNKNNLFEEIISSLKTRIIDAIEFNFQGISQFSNLIKNIANTIYKYLFVILVKYFFNYLIEKYKNYFVNYELTIDNTFKVDEITYALEEYLEENINKIKHKKIVVSSNNNSKSIYNNYGKEINSNLNLKYSLDDNYYYKFKFHNNIIKISSYCNYNNKSLNYTSLLFKKIKISSRKKETVHNFVKFITDKYNNKKVSNYIYESDNNINFIKKEVNLKKNFNNLFLPKSIEINLKYIVKEYSNIMNRKYDTGMSRKIGIMMSGHSGCGKTCSVYVLSQELNMPIYKISALNYDLKSLMNYIPSKSIILIDDFDNATSETLMIDSKPEQLDYRDKELDYRDKQLEKSFQMQGIYCVPTDNDQIENIPKQKNFKMNRIIHTLLEIFDGYNGLKNCLLVITTNRPEKIDKELLRPGRIDYHLNFGQTMSEEQLLQSFKTLYKNLSEEQINMLVKNKEKILKTKTMADIMTSISTYSNPNHSINYLLS